LRFRQKLLSTTWLRLLRRQVDSPKSTFLVLSTNQSYESSDMSAVVECLNLCVDFIFVVIVSKFDADFAFLTKSTHIIARTASRQCRRQKQGISVINCFIIVNIFIINEPFRLLLFIRSNCKQQIRLFRILINHNPAYTVNVLFIHPYVPNIRLNNIFMTFLG